MAFNEKQVKAKGGGSGKCPSIFTYNTTETQGEIEAVNYFGEGATFLTLGDIIYVSFDTSTFPYVVSHVAVNDGGAHDVNIQHYDAFVGDTRATDTAGCRVDGISQIIQGADGLFTTFAYRNNTDVKAVISADDYFIEAGLFLEVDDILYCVANDGLIILRVLTAGTAGVTTEEIVFA